MLDRIERSSPPAAKEKPRFRLVRKDPPPPPRKPSLSDALIPLLAEIDDDEWWSIAETPTPRGAAVMAGRCRLLGIPGWEWKAAGPEIFVRRAGQ